MGANIGTDAFASSPLIRMPPARALHGLVLAGGASRRMGQDKALLCYGDRPQLEVVFALLAPRVAQCRVSVRADQQDEPLRARFPQVVDAQPGIGAAAGLLAAHAMAPDAAWLVVACDLPRLDAGLLDTLIAARDVQVDAVAYRSRGDGLAEPLCTVWEPAALARLGAQVASGRNSLRAALAQPSVRLLEPSAAAALDNANTPADLIRLKQSMAP